MEIKGAKILVAGSAGGISSVVTNYLLEQGAFCYCHYHNTKPDFGNINCKYLQADITKKEEVTKMFKQIDKLDCLVNVIGIERIEENPLDLDTWKEIFDVNIFGAVLLAENSIKKMETGVVINISSVVGNNGITFDGESIAYPASKSSLTKLSEGICALYKPKIRAVTISPGYVKTPMWDKYDEKFIEDALKMVPNNKFVDALDIAKLVLQIIENESINGVDLKIDNGLSLNRLV